MLASPLHCRRCVHMCTRIARLDKGPEDQVSSAAGRSGIATAWPRAWPRGLTKMSSACASSHPGPRVVIRCGRAGACAPSTEQRMMLDDLCAPARSCASEQRAAHVSGQASPCVTLMTKTKRVRHEGRLIRIVPHQHDMRTTACRTPVLRGDLTARAALRAARRRTLGTSPCTHTNQPTRPRQ